MRKPGQSQKFKFSARPLEGNQVFLTKNFSNFKKNFIGKNCDIFMLKTALKL